MVFQKKNIFFIIFYILNTAPTRLLATSDEYYEDYDIDIDSNEMEIKYLPSDSLDISNQHIPRLNAEFFTENDILSEIKLDNNKISSIDYHTFNKFKTLVRLEINSNNLSFFDIEPISSLKELKLSNNSLAYLNSSNFQKLHLNILDVSFNNISAIFCENIEQFINLSHNHLSSICIFSFKIKKIDLSFNNISYIPNERFKLLYYLEHLDLSYNRIATIQSNTFFILNKLKYLNLSHNNFTELYLTHFVHLSNLVVLDLSYNNISIIHENLDSTVIKSPRFLEPLSKLYLHGNQVKEINITNLIRVCSDLTVISISFADISCSLLQTYISKFDARLIHVVKGPIKDQENINGIKCDSSLNTFIDSDNIDKMLNLLNKIKAILIVLAFFFVIFVITSIVINCQRFCANFKLGISNP